MRCSKFLPLACLATFLFGCATQSQKVFAPPSDYVPIGKIQISSKFQTIELTRETLAAEIKRCVPQISTNSEYVNRDISSFPSTNIALHGHASSASQFWVNRTTGMCLKVSSERFPVLAGEAFFDTVNPVGVPPDVTDGWYKQIALLIATKGAAKVAFTFKKGAAFVADYWVEPRQGHKLHYSSSYRKEGSWEFERVDLRFSHPSMSSISQTKRGNETAKVNLLSHRLP